jgi:ATP-dependent DNA helicase DinG
LAPALEALLIPGTDDDVVQRYATLAERAKEATFGTAEPEYVVLDTETTGFDPHSDALIEIAAARVSGPRILERFSTFVDPGRPIPALISELTGISDADVAGAPDAARAVKQLIEFVGDCAVIAHNAPFDHSFIAANAPHRCALVDEQPWIDTVELARIALPRLKQYNLMMLSEAFGVTPSTHRAIDDVEALCGIWRVLLVALSDLPQGLPRFLAELFPQTEWHLRAAFELVAWQDEASGGAPARFNLSTTRSERLRTLPTQQKHDAFDLERDFVPLVPVDAQELADAFSYEGLIGGMYPGYEPRGEQVEMACEVARALREGSFTAIEAGTGVGKSVAYLLPQALFAQRNKVTCGIATKTNALLDQLVYQELPRLSALLAGGIQYVALKGYDHYPCLRKLMTLAQEDRAFEHTSAPALVATLLSFVSQSSQGDMDSVSLFWREVARHDVCASADDCLHHKCRYYHHCLLHGARKLAQNADIVVTNHALLFCDVMADNGILPPIRHWVVDEAHAVEDEARRQLSVALDTRTVMATTDGLLHYGGAFATLRRLAVALNGGGLLVDKVDAAQSEAQALAAISESFFSYVKELCVLGEKSSYDQIDLWINETVRSSGPWGVVVSTGRAMATRIDTLWNACRDILATCAQYNELTEAASDLAGLTSELKAERDALVCILDGEDSSYVYSAELNRQLDKHTDRLVAAQIDIGAVLLEHFYPNEKTVVFASATMAAGESFDYFMQGCGMDRLPPERRNTVQLESSYDFDGNMAVFLPSDLPEPTAPGYGDSLEQLLLEVHQAMGGSVLTLFTNRREMERLYGSLKPQLQAAGLILRCQTRGTSAKRLRDEFLANEQMSLFALRSFWEGFDAPGDTLRCVVIPRLPFSKPTDPLQQERAVRERDAWHRYVLPVAIIDLKQAAGRLIRSSTDTGALILADARLLTKRYGKLFLKALPSQQHYIEDTQAIAAHLRRL